MFTGNRGCLVDDKGRLARHHAGRLWITCVTSYRGWTSPLDRPRHWTPLFFLDDAVALAAGHRPCGLCRRDEYRSYQSAVTAGLGRDAPVKAAELDAILAVERLRHGRGLNRSNDRKLWTEDIDKLPDGTVVLAADGDPLLLMSQTLRPFTFAGWTGQISRPTKGRVEVLTPPTSVLALTHGFSPVLHASALV